MRSTGCKASQLASLDSEWDHGEQKYSVIQHAHISRLTAGDINTRLTRRSLTPVTVPIPGAQLLHQSNEETLFSSCKEDSHINDPKLTAMLKEQRRTPDLEARKQLIFDLQRYAAEQQYYVYINVNRITAS